MKEKWSVLEQHMKTHGVHTLLITDPKHVYYLTGFLSEPHERFLGVILIQGREPFMIVPALDEEAARSASAVTEIYTHTDTDNPYQVLKQALRGSSGILGLEKNYISLARYEAITEALGGKGTVDIGPWLQAMRVRKTDEEVGKIKHAVSLIEEVLKQSLTKVKVGVTENELVAEVEYQIRKLGADGPSFDSMVLTGDKTALPHGTPGTRQVAPGDLLMFDIGVYAAGYASDITRTFAVGDISAELQTVYNTVLAANEQAIRATRPGASFSEIDLAARQVIEDAGYGPYFIHRLGHGLGIDVHEYPSIHAGNHDKLQSGNIFTVEPGIYLPGKGGVRIEDDVLVTENGVAVLTTFPKTLTVVG
ncbi:peptidase M24 family protein [Paenibacillus sp. CAA11]|uniref:M24 family metallopeptidase n=1 Tax=Paenibacillus sp. CAA11 TaxID=1532905 RepID=UPI000D39479C|nr:Xaa-Pro peptidase family protein [Paenibacillus sp. CAA11]AWB43857.1 peptidase M24 family protein [Paenibacillus sp. CAA11]